MNRPVPSAAACRRPDTCQAPRDAAPLITL